MDLSKGYEGYRNDRKQAGSNSITQAERKARKLQREIGELRLDFHTRDEQVFAALVNWKREQLRRMDYLDVFRFKWLMDLLESIRLTEQAGFSGVLSALYAGDLLIAVHLGLRSYHVLSSWIPTFNPEFGRYSPGLILHNELAKKAAEAGVRRIDLGRGENSLKTSLMSGAIPVAIGSVELRPLHRLARSAWHGLREFVHSSPLQGAPLHMYRRVRNILAHD